MTAAQSGIWRPLTRPFTPPGGIRVGSTRAEVENAYRTLQDPPFNGQEFPGVWYSSQEGRLKPAILFFFEDGLVSRIAVDFRTH